MFNNRWLLDWFDRQFSARFATSVSERYSPPKTRPGEQSASSYQICTQCIMDTTDPEITFDDKGVCNHCHRYDEQIALYVRHGDEGWHEMQRIADTIRREGKDKPYDCVIGLSGGVDSTYVAYLVVKKLGLRPLAVHMDNGWNTEIAVSNIENTVSNLGIDLHTEVLNWKEFRDLQASFIRAGVPDCEIPTDHAISATLYEKAISNGIKYIIGGSNLATEQMVPRTWSAGHGDWRYIRNLQKRFGSQPLTTYPHFTFWEHAIKWPYIDEIKMVYVLNYIEYDKFEAIDLMKRELGWVSYGDKHHESIYTRFYQTQYLPQKFGADKRRPHLSCLIKDKRITREQALREMQRPAIDEETATVDKEFVLKKLGISEPEMSEIMARPPRTYWDFDSDEKYFPDHGYAVALRNIDILREPVRGCIRRAVTNIRNLPLINGVLQRLFANR